MESISSPRNGVYLISTKWSPSLLHEMESISSPRNGVYLFSTKWRTVCRLRLAGHVVRESKDQRHYNVAGLSLKGPDDPPTVSEPRNWSAAVIDISVSEANPLNRRNCWNFTQKSLVRCACCCLMFLFVVV